MRTIPNAALALLVAVGTVGCTSSGTEPSPQLAGVLDEFTTDTDYAATKRCLSSFDYDNVEILDEEHILFKRSPGDQVWLNTLRARCPGLRRNDTLLFEKTGNRLCNLDTAKVVDRFLFWRRTGPVCSLGDFHQLTENQAQLLRQATKQS